MSEQEIVEQLKKEYPNTQLFCVNLAGKNYYIRPMNRSDYSELEMWASSNSNAPVSEYEERVLDTCLLYPDRGPLDRVNEPAGVVPTLFQTIMEKSLLDSDSPELLNLRIVELRERPVYEKPTEDEVKAALSSCKLQLKMVSICGRHFIIRPVLRSEFSALQKKINNREETDFDLDLVKMCTLHPKNPEFETLEAGVVTILSQQVLQLSGFSTAPEVKAL